MIAYIHNKANGTIEIISAVSAEELTDKEIVELQWQYPFNLEVETYLWLAFSEDPVSRYMGRRGCAGIINRARLLQAAANGN